MSFYEENSDNESGSSEVKPKTFFGLGLGDGVVYTIVIVLTLIFIRQVMVVIQGLN